MAVSSWLCNKNTRKMFLKIVYPGGHVELHDMPVLAAEIMLRNPKCSVAHPDVFKKPWSIVAAEKTLFPGQKFYVVPISTIRKLQRHSQRYSSSSSSLVRGREVQLSAAQIYGKDEAQGDAMVSVDSELAENNKQFLDDCCLLRLMIAGNQKKHGGQEETCQETGSSSSCGSSSETKVLAKNRAKDSTTEEPTRRSSSFDPWQPRLESITEE